jgi:hypothetical protein
MLVGRINERQTLLQALKSKDPEMVAVIGLERTGKLAGI